MKYQHNVVCIKFLEIFKKIIDLYSLIDTSMNFICKWCLYCVLIFHTLTGAEDMRIKPLTIVLLMLLLSSLAAPFLVNQAAALDEYQITIQQDGRDKYPADAPVAITDNTYTLTDDFSGYIVIQRTNATLDGDGHLIEGDYENDGVTISAPNVNRNQPALDLSCVMV